MTIKNVVARGQDDRGSKRFCNLSGKASKMFRDVGSGIFSLYMYVQSANPADST